MNLSYSDTLYAIVGFGFMGLALWATLHYGLRSVIAHDLGAWLNHRLGRG